MKIGRQRIACVNNISKNALEVISQKNPSENNSSVSETELLVKGITPLGKLSEILLTHETQHWFRSALVLTSVLNVLEKTYGTPLKDKRVPVIMVRGRIQSDVVGIRLGSVWF